MKVARVRSPVLNGENGERVCLEVEGNGWVAIAAGVVLELGKRQLFMYCLFIRSGGNGKEGMGYHL